MYFVDMACKLQRCQALLAGDTVWDLEEIISDFSRVINLVVIELRDQHP